jgi:ATP-binding cassette, subfamily B, bacterial PglK
MLVNTDMNTYRKVFSLLTKEQRYKLPFLLILMLIGMILETVGIGLIVPAIAIMTGSNIAEQYPLLAPLFAYLGNPTQAELIKGGMIALVAFYLVKTLFLIFLTWFQNKFILNVQAGLSQKLFRSYLYQSWPFHLSRNSGLLIQNVVGETGVFSNKVFRPIMLILTESLVLFGISVLLIYLEPFGSLLVLTVLLLTSSIFYFLTRKHVINWGKRRQYHDGLRIKHVQQGFGGVKDVKILGREDQFSKMYESHNYGSAETGIRINTMQQMPRLMLELFTVMSLAALVITMLAQGKSPDLMMVMLGVFAAAAFRLMPSINRVLGAVQSLRFGTPVVDSLHKEVGLFEDFTTATVNVPCVFEKRITIENAMFSYEGASYPSLQSISLEIPKGCSIGFIGESGAGKSTLIDVILGLLKLDRGFVKVDGVDVQLNIKGWQNILGYVPQSIFLTDDTIRKNVALGVSDEMIDDDAINRAISAAQLDVFTQSLPDGLETLVGERGVALSGGQLQRVGIARALYHDPQVLILDEATSSLDLDTERSVMKAINQLHGKKTVLIVAHRISTMSECDKLYKLVNGKIVAEGSYNDITG